MWAHSAPCILLAGGSCPLATHETTLVFPLRCCLSLLSICVGRGACLWLRQTVVIKASFSAGWAAGDNMDVCTPPPHHHHHQNEAWTTYATRKVCSHKQMNVHKMKASEISVMKWTSRTLLIRDAFVYVRHRQVIIFSLIILVQVSWIMKMF